MSVNNNKWHMSFLFYNISKARDVNINNNTDSKEETQQYNT